MAGHPTATWVDGMDDQQLRRWLEESLLPFALDAWHRGDAEAWLSVHAEDFVVTSVRYLAAGRGDRVRALKDNLSYRKVFTDQSFEVVDVHAPTGALVRAVLRDDSGLELGLLYGHRFRDGQVAEGVVADDTDEGMTLVRDHLAGFEVVGDEGAP